MMRRGFFWPGVVMLALAACSSAPKQDANTPNAADIYVRKGVQYMEAGQFEFALQDLQHAVELDPKNPEAHNALGVLFERLNRSAEAEQQYQQALSLDSGNANTLNNYGRFLCGKGQYEKAMGCFSQIIDSRLYGQPWIVLTNAGLCARSQGRRAEGEEFLRKALEANPTFAPALLEMARVSLDAGQYLSARAFLQRYEAAGAMGADALWIGAQTEFALGNTEAATDYINSLRSRFPDSRETAQARRLSVQ